MSALLSNYDMEIESISDDDYAYWDYDDIEKTYVEEMNKINNQDNSMNLFKKINKKYYIYALTGITTIGSVAGVAIFL